MWRIWRNLTCNQRVDRHLLMGRYGSILKKPRACCATGPTSANLEFPSRLSYSFKLLHESHRLTTSCLVQLTSAFSCWLPVLVLDTKIVRSRLSPINFTDDDYAIQQQKQLHRYFYFYSVHCEWKLKKFSSWPHQWRRMWILSFNLPNQLIKFPF